MTRTPFIVLVVGLTLLFSSCINAPGDEGAKNDISAGERQKQQQKLQQHIKELSAFAHSQNASARLGFLVDMSLPSWKKRIFAVNLETGAVLTSGLCAHGQGADYRREEATFSNVP